VDTNAYVAFLVVGAVMVVIDGQIIYHSGKRYLAHAQGDAQAGASMTNLIAVLFHLVVLGVLALISTIDFPGGSSLPAVVGRLGVLLLVVAIAHAIALGVLARMREEQVAEDITTHMNSRVSPVDQPLRDPTVAPVPGQEGRHPRTSPGIEYGSQYSTEQ
jgi:hypothetical protein